MVVSTSANSFGALQEAGEGGAPAPGKACSICGESKAESEFSKKQWVAKAHSRRCAACVESGAVATGAGKGPQGLVPVTPAPWYDEDLAPEFQGETPSMVLDPEYGHLLEQIDRGDFHPDDVIPTGVNKDTTLLQAAAAAADIPLMRAVLRRGARIDRYNGGGNALQMLCGMCRVQGDAYGQRSRFKAIEFLLTVGADPNAQPDADNGDGGSETGTYLTITPLHQAVQIRDGELSKRVCELLLQHKADPAAKHEGKTVLGSAPSKALQMTLKALINRYQSVDRPARRCPCGSERLYESCHGAMGGVPMHPRAMCGCTKPGNKTYQECCLEAGKVLFEKIPQHPPLMPASTDKVDVPHMTEDAAAAFQKEHKMQLMRSMVGPLVSRGECDSAYAYAAARSAFMVARPWRNNGVAVLPKAEMERRQRDWNALVDEVSIVRHAVNRVHAASETRR